MQPKKRASKRKPAESEDEAEDEDEEEVEEEPPVAAKVSVSFLAQPDIHVMFEHMCVTSDPVSYPVGTATSLCPVTDIVPVMVVT